MWGWIFGVVVGLILVVVLVGAVVDRARGVPRERGRRPEARRWIGKHYPLGHSGGGFLGDGAGDTPDGDGDRR